MKCPWPQNHPLLEVYHGREWGTPIHEDIRHFEFFTMDLFQAGLSWLTILKKRDFKFVGSTIMYAYMQAAGMVNDHLTTCDRCRELNR
jgi:3-methyladenine DNA glycosylase Tag